MEVIKPKEKKKTTTITLEKMVLSYVDKFKKQGYTRSEAINELIKSIMNKNK